jgi:hypothetical protein
MLLVYPGWHRRFEAAFFGYFLCSRKESDCCPAQGQRKKYRKQNADASAATKRMPPKKT